MTNLYVALLVSILRDAIAAGAAVCTAAKRFTHKGPLSPAAMLRLFIGAEGGSLDTILRAAGIEVSASAVTQRRAQIPPEAFRKVFDQFNADCADDEFYKGYRLLAVDGTTINLPRNPKAPSFVCHDGIPNGVNQLHVTPLYDLLCRTFADVVIQPEP